MCTSLSVCVVNGFVQSISAKSFTCFYTTDTNNDLADGSIYAKGIVTYYQKLSFSHQKKSICFRLFVFQSALECFRLHTHKNDNGRIWSFVSLLNWIAFQYFRKPIRKKLFFFNFDSHSTVTYVHFLRRVQTFSNAIFTCHCYGKKSYFSFYFLTLFLPKLHCIYTTCNGRHAHTCTSINHKISSQILIRYCVHVFAPFFFSFLFFSLQFCSIWFGVVILLS